VWRRGSSRTNKWFALFMMKRVCTRLAAWPGRLVYTIPTSYILDLCNLSGPLYPGDSYYMTGADIR
jgi:hypothetical protein